MNKAHLVALCFTVLGSVSAEAQGDRLQRPLGTVIDIPPAPLTSMSNGCRDNVGPANLTVCKVKVTVTPGSRCKVEVDRPALMITKGNANRTKFLIVWELTLNGAGGPLTDYSFDPSVGIEVLQEQGADKAEFGDLKIVKNDDGDLEPTPVLAVHRVMLRSRIRTKPDGTVIAGPFPFVYHYNVNILRKDPGFAQWIQCGGIDPLIVNTD